MMMIILAQNQISKGTKTQRSQHRENDYLRENRVALLRRRRLRNERFRIGSDDVVAFVLRVHRRHAHRRADLHGHFLGRFVQGSLVGVHSESGRLRELGD